MRPTLRGLKVHAAHVARAEGPHAAHVARAEGPHAAQDTIT